jgi:two-component system, chemotaxis family, protein-glutamate methylesterase/glutaminase
LAIDFVVVGASLGGFNALGFLLSELPASLSVPIAVVQHRSSGSGESLKVALQRRCRLRVQDAQDKERIQSGRVYLAPADYHLLVERGSLALSTDPPVCNARPSVDVLFESAADAYGADLAAVVLTGANRDGSQGAAWVKRRGGTVIVQDPATAECPIMPRSAIEAAAVDFVLPLVDITKTLTRLCEAEGATS